MPIYEYLCKACGHQLEAIQGFNDEPLKKCPECNASKLEKQISKPSFHLKGTGWYVTDFKDSGQKEKKSKDEKEDKPKPDSTTEEKSKTEKDTPTEDKKVKADKPEKSKSESKD
jgi:putative FmdB family regulatory protein